MKKLFETLKSIDPISLKEICNLDNDDVAVSLNEVIKTLKTYWDCSNINIENFNNDKSEYNEPSVEIKFNVPVSKEIEIRYSVEQYLKCFQKNHEKELFELTELGIAFKYYKKNEGKIPDNLIKSKDEMKLMWKRYIELSIKFNLHLFESNNIDNEHFGELIDDKWKKYRNITNNENAWCFVEWLKKNPF